MIKCRFNLNNKPMSSFKMNISTDFNLNVFIKKGLYLEGNTIYLIVRQEVG